MPEVYLVWLSYHLPTPINLDFIQDYSNGGKETSVENWAQFQAQHSQEGIYGQEAGGCQGIESCYEETSGVRGFDQSQPTGFLMKTPRVIRHPLGDSGELGI